MNLVEIIIRAKDEASDQMNKTGNNVKKSMANVGLAVGAAAVAVAAESVKMATEFQSSTTRLVTSAGETSSNLAMVRKGMLAMAGEVGDSAVELSKGMYTVESAGFHGAEGLKVLKAAAEGAKDENADLGKVADGVTDALVDYHLKASAAATVTSQLVTAVSFGKTNFDKFSGSMHSILPLASALHLSLADVTGVLAEMTSHGVTANQAAMNIANAMRHLADPTYKETSAWISMGLSVKKVDDSMSKNGLQGTMELLSKTAEQAGKIGTPQYTAALASLMGTAQGLNVALMTTGENSAGTQKAIAGISAASADAKGNVKGFAEMQATLKQKTADLKASFDTLMIELGNKLIPILSSVTAEGVKMIGWMQKNPETVKAVAVAVGLLTVALAALGVSLSVNPVSLIILALYALAVAFGLAWAHSEKFRDVMTTVFMAVGDTVLQQVNFYLHAMKLMTDGTLDSVILILRAFGEIPGDTWAKKAAKNVEGFRNKADDAFNGAIQKTKDWKDAVDKMPKEIRLEGNIKDLNDKIAAGKAKLKTLPPSKQVALKASIGQLIAKRNAAQAALNALKGKTVVITMTLNNHAGKIADNMMAAGGIAGASAGRVIGAAANGGLRTGLTLVGEHGPELADLAPGTRVHSNPDTERILSGARQGGGVLQIEWVGGHGGDSEFISWLKKGIRIRGGNVATVLGSS